MDIEREIGRIFTALDAGTPIENLMRADEVKKGYQVVVPGDVPWLSPQDWPNSVVVSVDTRKSPMHVRIIAILAKRPGNGAFRRLIQAIREFGMIPCVLEPTREMRTTLKRWGWKGRRVGRDMEMEERWYPRPNKTDGFAETRAQLDELAQQAEGSHRQHIGDL